MNKERLPGYYWVKVPEEYVGEEKWVIAEWYIPLGYPENARWELHGVNINYDEDYFLEIDETPIKRDVQSV